MEFIALLLLAPLIWSSDPASTVPAPTEIVGEVASREATSTPNSSALAQIESVDGQLQIRPPRDQSLTMTVVEHRPTATSLRGPASVASRRIDVIVSAP